MTDAHADASVDFAPFAPADGGLLIVFAGEGGSLPTAATDALGDGAVAVKAAMKTSKFKGKAYSALNLIAPHGSAADRVLVVGCAVASGKPALDFVRLGGFTQGKRGGGAKMSVIFAGPGDAWNGEAAADFALGLKMRAYEFNLYKTKKKKDDDDESAVDGETTIRVADVEAARHAGHASFAVAEGVKIARDLVNEPPNVLHPEEFARRAGTLKKLGVEIETLGEKEIEKLGMGALLGVGLGSVRETQLVIMRWNGGKKKEAPVAFVGKGVTFDTGGISIKPSGGMEDMKGDMAGAACVVGLMHALAKRKAKVNAVGAIGLVENMPDGKAIRPGDILTSMSGQTIEIISTDAEGRLVLADVLWHVKHKFKPKFMVDLATLTGAIIVALGQQHAGLFSNNDELAARLSAAGEATGEKVWRMPLSEAYDKLIDSKFADMKNAGGRHGGSITAAQFLARFVDGAPWAHLDIAGVGMASPATDVNTSWGSGWGVRLLNRLVADHYES